VSGLSLRIGLADRAPGPDEEEGERLVTMVRDGLQRGVRGAQMLPVALVFLEWADDRWWHWERLLRDGEPASDEEDDLERYSRAIDGDPIPDGLGRWFVRGRRTRASLSLGELRRPAIDGTQLVH
jgi:hypothetical protein